MSILFICLLWAQASYPESPGFNHEGSDSKAIALADQCMVAMGGYEAYNQTRFVSWRFFGKRLHVWDKWTGALRFENKDTLVLMNVNSKQGRVFKAGQEVTDPAERDKALQDGYEAWINDSYWVFMPYKLKDSGVTLRYVGEGQMADGRAADILELTFANVGVTPENKYHVAIAKDTHLVEEWSFFEKFSDEKPAFTTPWSNWKKYGNILLSDDRGKAKHTDLHVYETLPESVFTDPAPWP